MACPASVFHVSLAVSIDSRGLNSPYCYHSQYHHPYPGSSSTMRLFMSSLLSYYSKKEQPLTVSSFYVFNVYLFKYKAVIMLGVFHVYFFILKKTLRRFTRRTHCLIHVHVWNKHLEPLCIWKYISMPLPGFELGTSYKTPS